MSHALAFCLDGRNTQVAARTVNALIEWPRPSCHEKSHMARWVDLLAHGSMHWLIDQWRDQWMNPLIICPPINNHWPDMLNEMKKKRKNKKGMISWHHIFNRLNLHTKVDYKTIYANITHKSANWLINFKCHPYCGGLSEPFANCIKTTLSQNLTWWRHQMETFSA